MAPTSRPEPLPRSTSTPGLSPPAELPARIGQYEILRRIAYGGMGEVFLGRLNGAGGFTKDVVVKRLLPQFVEVEECISMFRDEARITSQLLHGNIAQLHGFGEDDGRYFLALEYVNGPSLARLITALRQRDEQLSIAETAHIISEVSRALDYAHKKLGADGQPLEVVHRDVSPSNILISLDGEVKLTDFGIARARERLASTQAGSVKGKFGYMAPETILRGQADARSDLFALGAVLFEALTSTPPFRCESDAQTVHRVISGDILPPSRVNAAVPPELDALVMRLLARDPKQRPARALELVEALRPFCYASVPPAADRLSITLERLFRRAEADDGKTLIRPFRAQRVLLVDESRTVRALVKVMIGKKFEIQEAATIEEAMGAMLRVEPNAVLCQRNIQGRSPFEICRLMRSEPRLRRVPLALLATDVTPELTREAEAAGAQAVIEKNTDGAKLEQTLNEVIARGVGAG